MQALENVMNKLTDLDGGWWPFLYLRPSKEQLLDNARLLKMSLHFGPLFGLLIGLIPFVLGATFSVPLLALSALGMSLGFFVCYKFTFAFFWNRRARRLQAGGLANAT